MSSSECTLALIRTSRALLLLLFEDAVRVHVLYLMNSSGVVEFERTLKYCAAGTTPDVLLSSLAIVRGVVNAVSPKTPSTSVAGTRIQPNLAWAYKLPKRHA